MKHIKPKIERSGIIWTWGDWMEWQENEDYGFGEYD